MSNRPDLLSGTREIAAYLGVTPRRALYLAEAKRLPHFRIGKIICARRAVLTEWLADLERQGTAAG